MTSHEDLRPATEADRSIQPDTTMDEDRAADGVPATEAVPAADAPHRRLGRRWWVAGVALASLVVVAAAFLASSDPDGLERVATDNGFIEQATNFFSGLFSGYAIPGIDDPRLSTILSGLLGVAIVLGAVFLLGRVLARRRA